jgi:uncharacterized Fe-S center protein
MLSVHSCFTCVISSQWLTGIFISTYLYLGAMSRVTLLPEQSIGRFQDTLADEIRGFFSPGNRIAVKVHFGEPGNRYALSPDFLHATVRTLQSLDVSPFLFDSPVAYNSPRNSVEGYLKTLKNKNITKITMGCPVIISNQATTVDTNKLKYSICTEPIRAEGVLVLSHVKGHICTGFGGALKNIGMGGMAKNTKRSIHQGGEPRYSGDCCECGACITSCPLGNIRLFEGRPYFDKNWCCGCSTCVSVCEYGCIEPKNEVFDRALVTGVRLALERYRNVFYVNVVRDVMCLCDCVANPGRRLAKNVGVLFGTDIVAVEKASLDCVTSTMGRDVFEEEHHKSPAVHIKEAEAQGLGSTLYELMTAI